MHKPLDNSVPPEAGNPNPNPPNNGNPPPNDGDPTLIERYKQQLHGWEDKARKEAEAKANAEERANKVLQTALQREYKRVFNNGNFDIESFRELYEDNQELADSLATQFRNKEQKPFADAQEILNLFGTATPASPVNQKPAIDPEELKNDLFQKIKSDMEHDAAIKTAQGRFGTLPAEKQKEAEEYFKKISGNRKLNVSEANEYAEMAALYVMKDNIITGIRDNSIANMGNMTIGNIAGLTPAPKQDDNYSDDEIMDYIVRHTTSPKDKEIFKSILSN